MNGLIHNDLVISILVVALLTAVGRLVLGVFSVGLGGAAVFVLAGYVVVYLSNLLWRRLRARLPRPAAPARVDPPAPAATDEAQGEEPAGGGSTVQA